MAVIVDGEIRQTGEIADVASRPADHEVARLVGVETVVPAHVVDQPAEGLLLVDAAGVLLTALDRGGIDGSCFVCIRAEDVMLERGPIGHVSARNRLAGRISAITAQGPLVKVSLDCGFTLCALVTRPAQEELGLAVGETVAAFVKSPAIHLVPRTAG
jgi:molybdopterin-binding protein